MPTTPRLLILGALALAAVLSVAFFGPASHARQQPQPGTPPAEPVRIATVDVYLISEQIMERAELKEARDAIEERWNEQLRPLEAELTRIQTTLQALPPSDPKVAQLLAEGRSQSQLAQQGMERREAERQELYTAQIIRAYEQIRDAVNIIAERERYTHVFASRDPDLKIDSTNVNLALQHMLARPLIKRPHGADITDQVLAEIMKN